MRDFTRHDLYYASVKFTQQSSVKEITKEASCDDPGAKSSYRKGEMLLPGIQRLLGMPTTYE